MNHSLKHFRVSNLLLLLTCLLLSSCNASIEKVAKKSNTINDKYRASIQYPLASVFDSESLNNIEIKDKDFGNHYYNLISHYAAKSMESDLSKNLFAYNDKNNYNGYIRCSLESYKFKTKCWELIPTVATLFVYTSFGGPMAHTTLERIYRFDIFDARGNNIKSYTVKGSARINHGLYTTSNYEGGELKAFRNALKKFEEAAAKDAFFINGKLNEASQFMTNMRNRQINERDMILADWLNSGELPSDKELNEAVTNAPEDYVGWGLRAVKNENNGRYSDALEDVNEYCRINPACNIMRPYYQKAKLLYQLNRKSEAYEAICVADELYPNDEAITLLKGRILFENRAFSDALLSFEKASQINPDNTDTYQLIDITRKTCKQLAENRKQEEEEELIKKAYAMQSIGNAMTNTANSIATLNNHNNNRSINSSSTYTHSSSNSSNQPKTVTKDCSMCHGRGWIAGTSGVSFDSSTSYYCKECGREVPSSHTHEVCPACRGNKVITTIRR